jgi:EAL domain-containing protein (putative c-di-GMP-specific phosphodiesterase class I)
VSRGKLVALVQRVLATTGLAPERLCLEITEQLLLEHSEANLASIDELRNMGIAIAIDDFGVGYSSLGYIRRFHPSKIKIDCSLIRHVASSQDDAALVHAAISMAHGLRIEVVAEGVEHEDQRAFLQAEGCDMAQGFLYATPLPAAAFHAWISAWRGPQAPG